MIPARAFPYSIWQRESSEVENPEHEVRERTLSDNCFFLDFLNDKYRVWCMDHKTVKRHYTETYGISDEDVEDKLNVGYV